MESHSGEKGGRAELFTGAGQSVDLERFLADSRKDPRAWTIIVSPQYGEQLHMDGFTRSFIAQGEKDTGVSLDYIAAIYRNTPHTHVHDPPARLLFRRILVVRAKLEEEMLRSQRQR
jgi:hypothetical protein